MKLQELIDEIKLELTGGGILKLEIDDQAIVQIIQKALRELERYIDETTLITIPWAPCIDLTGEFFEEHVSSIVKVYRNEAIGDANAGSIYTMDPMFAQQWMLFSNGGTMYNLNDYILNYASWLTLDKIKNTLSTDMAFKEDRHNKKLYINRYMSAPSYITIEYVPKIKSIEDISSDYWIDILVKLSTALAKVVVGRIRTRFTQSNALWAQDGDKMLEEGTTELKELREILRNNSNLVFGID